MTCSFAEVISSFQFDVLSEKRTLVVVFQFLFLVFSIREKAVFDTEGSTLEYFWHLRTFHSSFILHIQKTAVFEP